MTAVATRLARALLDNWLKRDRDVSQYMRKPAAFARAMLLAARDGAKVVVNRTAGSQAKAMPIPEVHDALVKFGRELKTGEAELKPLGAETAAQAGDELLSDLALTAKEACDPPPVEHFLTSAAQAKLRSWRSGCQAVLDECLQLEADAKAKQDAKVAKRARKEALQAASDEALNQAAADYDAAEVEAAKAAQDKADTDARLTSTRKKLDGTAYFCDCKATGGFHQEKCRLWGLRKQLTHPGLDSGLSRDGLLWFSCQGGSCFLLIVCS
jgi:hypothetical protein